MNIFNEVIENIIRGRGIKLYFKANSWRALSLTPSLQTFENSSHTHISTLYFLCYITINYSNNSKFVKFVASTSITIKLKK